MHPLVANTDDLISVLDRVLDKGIVLESWARLSLQETGPAVAGNRISVASSAVYVGYGTRGTGVQIWTLKISSLSGGGTSGANSPRVSPILQISHC